MPQWLLLILAELGEETLAAVLKGGLAVVQINPETEERVRAILPDRLPTDDVAAEAAAELAKLAASAADPPAGGA